MFCPRCGKENHDTNQYCGNCGESLKFYTQRSSPKTTPSPIVKQHGKTNEQQPIQARWEGKIDEYLQYIGLGPFILIILGLLTILTPIWFIFIIFAVAWIILRHTDFGKRGRNVNVRLTDR